MHGCQAVHHCTISEGANSGSRSWCNGERGTYPPIMNVVALNHFRDLEGQPRKDDEWDAYLAARMVFLKMKGSREAIETTEEERSLSRLTRTHSRLVEDRNRHVARLRAVLLEVAPEVLHSSWEGPQPGSKAMLYLLERWPGFEGLERAQLRSIEKILRRCRYGSRTTPVAKLIRKMARGVSIAREKRSAVTLESDLLAQQIRFCNESAGQVYAKIANRVEHHPLGKKLLEMHGNGPVITGVLVSELLPVARTSTEPKSATFAGVTPLSRKSGKSLDNDRLTQGANKRVHAGTPLQWSPSTTARWTGLTTTRSSAIMQAIQNHMLPLSSPCPDKGTS